eukprot:GILI01015217.1.p1 GENE.GILI01015217.1~~GILI01015217.1.p1  ORF type:complete len:958 (-),score=228.94 GILI01015217.1:93-2741(-)
MTDAAAGEAVLRAAGLLPSTSPSPSLLAPVAPQHVSQPAYQPAQAIMSHAPQVAAPSTSHFVSAPVVLQPAVVTPPPPPPPPAMDPETVARLRKQVEEKKLQLQTLVEKEKDLLEQQGREAERHAANLATIDSEIRQTWAEAEAERAKCDQQVREAEEEQEALLRLERKRIDDEAVALNKPRVDALNEELKVLREKRAALVGTLNMSSASKDAVTDAVAAAVKIIAEKIEANYQSTLAKDEDWERHMRELIRKEIRTSFATAAASEGEAEREEYKKAFEEMLNFWRSAEEDNKAFLTKLDEQMLQDLKSVAMEDMRRVQGEEQRVQEVYLEARESWARYHRNNLSEELESAIQRRTIEFEEHRAARQQLHVEQINQLERAHKEVTEARLALHDKELVAVRSAHRDRETLAAEKSKMILTVQEDAAKATQSISDTIQGVNKALLKLEQYRLIIDDGRANLDADRKKNLELRQNTLTDVQSIILSQANAVEAERKALSSALVKLQVVQRSVENQLEDERTWVASMGSKLERSRTEWEREYRRWQQVAQQEKLDAEQRFSNVLMDLRKTAVGLEQQGSSLEVEATALRRYGTERSSRQAADLQDLQRREEELSHRNDDLLRVLQDLEVQGKGIAAQWEDLHRERQQLAAQRDGLRQEEMRMQQMEDNVRVMRSQFDLTSAETARAADRNRSSRHQLTVTRDAVNADMRAVKEQSERLLRQRDQLAKDQQRVSEAAATEAPAAIMDAPRRSGAEAADSGVFDENKRFATGGKKHLHIAKSDPSRLPQQVLGELRQALTHSLAGGFGSSLAQPRIMAQPTTAPAAAAGNTTRPGQADQSTFYKYDASRISRGFQDPNSMHFTRLMGMSEFETTSVSQLGRESISGGD